MIVSEPEYWRRRKLLSHASYGKLKDYDANPRTFKMREQRDIGRIPTDDMVKGNMIDTLMFAANDFSDQFSILAFNDMRTNAAKAQKAAIEAAGKRMVKRDWIEDIVDTMLEVHRNNDNQPYPWSVLRPEGVSPEEYVGGLLGPNSPILQAANSDDEETHKMLEALSEPFKDFFSDTPRDLALAGSGQIAIVRDLGGDAGLHFMGKLDLVPDANDPIWGSWILDLKRTSAGGLKNWLSKVINFKYHWQAAYYLDLYNEEFRDTGDVRTNFGWIVVEDKWPYDCGIVRCTDRMIDAGRNEYSEAVMRYERSLVSDVWQSPYASTSTFATDQGIEYAAPVSIDLPSWYKKERSLVA